MKKEQKKNLMALLCLLLLLLCHDLYAQLQPFTLTVTPTPQTCLGNGGLSFSTSGTTAGASLDYAIYLLPDTSNPITIVTSPQANGLIAGTYQIIATQTLGSQSNTATATATINSEVIPLIYTLQANACSDGGTITVNVVSGNAVSYEIIAGPETRTLQTSNVFINLPVGLYSVRVHDVCGDAVVVDVNLQILPADFFIGFAGISDLSLTDCNKISVGNYIYNNYQMLWPVTLTLTVHPPNNGADEVINKVINEFSSDNIEYVDIPFYYDQNYTYDLKITDACGNTETVVCYIQNQKFDFSLTAESLSCNDFILAMDMSVYKTPCTVSFISAPTGFNPVSFNASHPVFSSNDIVYGSGTNPIPMGDYTVKITDACGHSATHTLLVTNEGTPTVNTGHTYWSSCYGYFTVKMPFSRGITTAVITAAPDNYPSELPQDGMMFVNGSSLTVTDIPTGSYTVVLTDSCGMEYTVYVVVNEGIASQNLYVNVLPGCEENKGSIAINDIKLTEVVITTAPDNFEYTLPFDASSNIWDTGFSMGSLPSGNYTINAVDNCGNVLVGQFYVIPYQILSDNTGIIPGCGSFNVAMDYNTNSNINFKETFWLQKYNDFNGKWTNPASGAQYTEGTPVYSANALEINNNTSNYFTYSGVFRIMRVTTSYSDPDDYNQYIKRCPEQIYEFTYYDNPHINGAYGFTCGDGTSDVIIDAEGLAPLTYDITSKNGEPFVLSNGAFNMFHGLEDGIYNFRVTDDCGNFLNIQYDITQLQNFSIQSSTLCDGQPGNFNVQGFSYLEYEWWKEGTPQAILSTNSTLEFDEFNALNDMGTYYVHITSNIPGSCIDETISIEPTIEPLPNAGQDNTISLCNEGQALDLNEFLEQPFNEGGIWSDEDTTGTLFDNILYTYGLPSGSYHFKYKVTNACGVADEAVVTIAFKTAPDAVQISAVQNSVCEGDTIELVSDYIEGAIYNWSGPDGFISNEQNPVLQNVSQSASGIYKLSLAFEGFECASEPVTVQVEVNKVPDFTIDGNSVICQNDAAILSVNPINFNGDLVIYTWYYNGEIFSNGTGVIQVNEEGNYKVVVNNNGCTNEKAINISNFNVEINADCIEESYILNLISDKDLTNAFIVWSGPDNYRFEGAEADITNFKGGQYTATVNTTEGCTALATLQVTNTNCSDVMRGISPNGDGMNDTFDLSNLGVKELEIFNRYGLKVYEAQNYFNEWHGQSDKGTLPSGTYYYVIKLSAGKQLTGWVYLQREE